MRGVKQGAGGIRKDAERSRVAEERSREVLSRVLCLRGKPRRCPGAESSCKSLKLQLVPEGTSVQPAAAGGKQLWKNTGTWKSIPPGLL